MWISLAYGVVFNYGFGQLIWFGMARTLPPGTSAMSIMAIPLVGTLSATVIVGETPHWQDWLAMGFVMVAIASVLWPAASGSATRGTISPCPRQPTHPPRLHLIYARASNGVIGKDNRPALASARRPGALQTNHAGLPRHHGPQNLGIPCRPNSALCPVAPTSCLSRDGEWSTEGAQHATSVQAAMACVHRAATSG